MPFNDCGYQCYALFGRDVRQSDKPGMRHVVQVD